MLEKEKKSNNRFKQTWTKMYESCHQKFKILFCEGNGSQTYSARGEDQYKSDLKSY